MTKNDKAKYYFKLNSALRFGVDLDFESEDVNLYEKNVYTDTTEIVEYNGDVANTQIYLALQYLYYFDINNSITPFVGIGAHYLYSPHSENITDYRIASNDSYGYGVNFLIGVEWFVRKNIGINAEYGARFGYNSYEYSYERPSYYSDTGEMNKDYSKTTGYSFSSNGVKFGLSIYF